MRIICTAIAAPLAARLPQLTGTGLPIRMSKSVLQRICQWLLGWLFFLFSFACLFIRWLLFRCKVARRSVTSKVEKESTRDSRGLLWAQPFEKRPHAGLLREERSKMLIGACGFVLVA